MAVAVAVAGSRSSDSIPSLGTSICCKCGPEKQEKKKKMMLELLRQEYLNFLLLLPPGVSEVDVDVGNREAPWETRIHLISAQASAQDSPVQRAPAKLPRGPWLMVNA